MRHRLITVLYVITEVILYAGANRFVSLSLSASAIFSEKKKRSAPAQRITSAIPYENSNQAMTHKLDNPVRFYVPTLLFYFHSQFLRFLIFTLDLLSLFI